MVTGEELVRGTKQSYENPLMEMKATYDAISREITTLEERQKKVLFHSNRLSNDTDKLANAAKNIQSPVSLKIFKDTYPVILETKRKINELLSDIKGTVIPNISGKIEHVARLIDDHEGKVANIVEFKKEVESHYHKVESAVTFVEEANKFLNDSDLKLAPFKSKARELGIDR